TERCAALFEQPDALEPIETLRKLRLAVMFGDYHAPRRNQARHIEIFQSAQVLGRFGVRRIEKYKICQDAPRGEPIKTALDVRFDHFRSTTDLERGEVFPDEARGSSMRFYENHFTRPAAKCFDSDRAGSRVEIEEQRFLYSRAKHVEERLAKPVACGAQAQRTRPLQPAAAIISGDHAHGAASFRDYPTEASRYRFCQAGLRDSRRATTSSAPARSSARAKASRRAASKSSRSRSG